MGVELDALLNGTGSQAHAPAMVWSTLPGWEEAISDARRLFPRVSDGAWTWLGSLSGPVLPGLPPAALGMIASAWDQVDHVRDEAPPRTVIRAKRGGGK